jgi:hypothetical protein
MKAQLGVGLFTTLSALAFTASADDAPPRSPEPPTLPAPAAPIVIAAPSSSPSCRTGDLGGGVDASDGKTAAHVVCAEILRAGPPAGASYRVDLGRLGYVFVLTVSREGSLPGSTVDAREVQLHGIEDVPAVAPKIAASIVSGTPLDDAEIDALTASKAQPRQSGRFRFALGLVGQFPPFDRSVTPSPGVDLEVHSEFEDFQIVGAFRFGANSDDNGVGNDFAAFSMGGRYFPGGGDIAPYVGAGFAWSLENIIDNVNHDFNGTSTGLGMYGEIGLEFLHTHHTHLAVGARLDIPFYSLKNDNGVAVSTPDPPPSMYYAPLALEMRLTF